MNKFAKLLIAVMLIALPSLGSAQTTQPAWLKPKLVFEKSEKTVGWRDDGHEDRIGPIAPTWAAAAEIEVESWFTLVGESVHSYRASDVSDLPHDRNLRLQKIKSSPLWPTLSPQQQKFWETSNIITIQPDKHFERNGKKFVTFTVSFFAVSERDARLMAEGVIELLNNERYKQLDNIKKKLASYKQNLQEARSRVAKLEENLKTLNAEIVKLQNTFHYTSPEPAFAEFVEMDKLVRLINIDIAGVKARMEAIKEIAIKIGVQNKDEKLTDLNIEMAGLLARRKAAQDDRDQAKRYHDLLKDVDKTVQAVRTEMTDYVTPYTKNIKALEEIVANPPEEMRPVKVIGNKVVIHPVVPQFPPKIGR